VLQDPGADAGPVRRPAQRAGQQRRHRAPLQPRAGVGKAPPARFPDPSTARRHSDADGAVLPPAELRGPGNAPGLPLPRRRAARAGAAALRGAPGVRARHHRQDGLPRLLPDRGRLHHLGQGQRLPGGPRARLGCRFAGGLRAVDHRPRPARLQPAVRALPQSRARLDARLRHRFLPGQPRPRHRLREGQVRPRRGEPDRHLRHHGGQGGAARRRARAGHELRPCGLDRQADPGAAGQERDAGPPAREARRQDHLRAPRGARTERARGRGRGGGHPAGAGHAGRGADAQHRHARRRRADRAGEDHRLLPALPAARQRLGGEPVRQGRRRGHRPGEVRLPGPGHADHPGAGQGLHPRRWVCQLRLRAPAAGRQVDLQAVRRRAHRGGVPVRKSRHAEDADGGQADAAGGPDRAQRHVPPRAAGEHPGLLRAQARPAQRSSTRTRCWARCWPRPTASSSTRSR
jgi:hypothetical protein